MEPTLYLPRKSADIDVILYNIRSIDCPLVAAVHNYIAVDCAFYFDGSHRK